LQSQQGMIPVYNSVPLKGYPKNYYFPIVKY
jgi:hypothetical protein